MFSYIHADAYMETWCMYSSEYLRNVALHPRFHVHNSWLQHDSHDVKVSIL